MPPGTHSLPHSVDKAVDDSQIEAKGGDFGRLLSGCDNECSVGIVDPIALLPPTPDLAKARFELFPEFGRPVIGKNGSGGSCQARTNRQSCQQQERHKVIGGMGQVDAVERRFEKVFEAPDGRAC